MSLTVKLNYEGEGVVQRMTQTSQKLAEIKACRGTIAKAVRIDCTIKRRCSQELSIECQSKIYL